MSPRSKSCIYATVLFFVTSVLFAQQPDRTPVIATSGDVEISAIRIARQKVSDAAKEADLTNMEIDLWFTSKAEGGPFRGLLKVIELAAIEDDTGKLLSTKARLDALPFLNREVSADQSSIARGKTGPVIRVLLDAPAREAKAIKSIKGKAVVSRSSVARLEFKDLSAISGKPLDHPKLKGFKIEPTIKVEDGDTVLTLRLPADHARLVFWGLVKDGGVLSWNSESSADGGKEQDKTYPGDQMKDSFLGLMIAEPSEPRTLDFNFQNVELP